MSIMLRIAALAVLGVLVHSCWDSTTCASCLNQGCWWCAEELVADGCWDSREHPNSFGICLYTGTMIPRDGCPPITCPLCTSDVNIYRVTYSEDALEIKCVLQDGSGCDDEGHVARGVYCFTDQECDKLEALDDPRVMQEGRYEYPKDSCVLREDCYQCLDGTGQCEYFAETMGGEEVMSCVPSGLVQPSQTVRQIKKCPCSEETTCAQCLNRESCVFCADDAEGYSGSCRAYCPNGVTVMSDRDICPPITCEECSRTQNSFQLTYGDDGITVKCLDYWSCLRQDHAIGTMRCYYLGECVNLQNMDDRLTTEGKYPYLEGACFERNCYECLDGTGECEFFAETVESTESSGCVPSGLIQPTKTLRQVETCPCSEETTCAQCLNQESCVFCADDAEGDSGSCRAYCPNGSTILSDRDTCPPITCEECGRTANVFQLTYGDDGFSVKCVESLSCMEQDHAVINTIECYNRGSCGKLQNMDARLTIEGEYPYLEGACFGRNCYECLDGTGECEHFTELSRGVTRSGCVPSGFIGPTKDLIKTEKCPEKTRCHDCADNEIYRVRYGTTAVHTSCVEHCIPVDLPVGTTYCYDKPACPELDSILRKTGFHPYPMESCFTKLCSACKATIDESGNPLCLFLTQAVEGRGNISGCVPVGFISGDDVYEPEDCPSVNAADGVGRIVIATCAILVAFAFHAS